MSITFTLLVLLSITLRSLLLSPNINISHQAIKSHQELLMATFNVERNNSSAINTSTTTSTNTTAAPITVPTTPPRPQHVRGTYTADSAPNKTLTNPFSFSSSPSTSTTNEPNKNTLVDDGFFIIKKCLRRGLSTMSSNVACAMINSASMILEAPYFASFENVIARLMVLHATTDIHLPVALSVWICFCCWIIFRYIFGTTEWPGAVVGVPSEASTGYGREFIFAIIWAFGLSNRFFIYKQGYCQVIPNHPRKNKANCMFGWFGQIFYSILQQTTEQKSSVVSSYSLKHVSFFFFFLLISLSFFLLLFCFFLTYVALPFFFWSFSYIATS